MAQIHSKAGLKNRRHVFADRLEAGRVLGQMLAPAYAGADDLVLLPIPMGGVPVAVRIREALGGSMDLMIVRKIQIPGNTEAGFGAMTSEGDVFLNEALLAHLELGQEQVARQEAAVRADLQARERCLRGGRPFPELAGRTVVLVDDGLASGFTMKAAVYLVNKRRAGHTIVAVPTAPKRTIDDLAAACDEIYCPNVREGYSFAVADAYRNWHDLDEGEVVAMLDRSEEIPPAARPAPEADWKGAP